MTIGYRIASTMELGPGGLAGLRGLFAASWPEGDFSPEDMEHALGGRHFVASDGPLIVGHASVVPRQLEVGGRPLRTGYVEGVATLPAYRRQGIATRLMQDAGAYLRGAFELGALSTDVPALYARLGWQPWEGKLFVREPGGLRPCSTEDEGIMVIATLTTPPLTLLETLTCEWRPGDAW